MPPRARGSLSALRRTSAIRRSGSIPQRSNAAYETASLPSICIDPAATRTLYSGSESGSSSVVECFLAKEDVAGSTPVSRSKILPYPSFPHPAASPVFTAWRGTQVVRERSAKPLCVGSIPTRASMLYVQDTRPPRSLTHALGHEVQNILLKQFPMHPTSCARR